MTINKNITLIGELEPTQYLSLISPSEEKTDTAGSLVGRKIQWIRRQITWIPLFFRRLAHWLFHSNHTYENDRSLYNRFKNGLLSVRQIDSAELPQIQCVANELILRNPDQDTPSIRNALNKLTPKTTKKSGPKRTKQFNTLQLLKDAETAENRVKGKKIGLTDTLDDNGRFLLLNPTLNPDLLKKRQEDELSPEVQDRRKELMDTKKYYRPTLNPDKQNMLNEILNQGGKLVATIRGQGGAYFLKNKNKQTEYVVKPHGEGSLCVDNRKRDIDEDGTVKSFNSYFHCKGIRVRPSIPLYFEALSETLFYEVAKLSKFEEYAPETFFAILSSKEFFHRAEDPLNRQPKEKLCSVQKFMKNTGRLSDFKSKKRRSKIDLNSIATSILLDGLCGNTDRYSDNCLVDKKGRLLNIDNGLCFPENNSELRICTATLSQARNQFPQQHKDIINALSDENHPLSKQLFSMIMEKIQKHAEVSGWEAKNLRMRSICISNIFKALKDRVAMMKWGIDKNKSMREIGLRLIALPHKALAYQEKQIRIKDVPPFQVGRNGDKTWSDILITRKPAPKPPEIENLEDEESSDFEDSGTFIIHDEGVNL